MQLPEGKTGPKCLVVFSDNGDGGDSCGNADGDFRVGSASASTVSPHQSESHVLSSIGFAVKDANCLCVDTAFARFLDMRWTMSMLTFMKNVHNK
jgi:hypothetical protein